MLNTPAGPSPMVLENKNLSQVQGAKLSGNKMAEMQYLTQAASNGGYWPNMFAGDFYRKSKQYSKAIQYYQNALNATTQYSTPLLYLGICYFEMKKYILSFIITLFIISNPLYAFANEMIEDYRFRIVPVMCIIMEKLCLVFFGTEGND